MLPCEKAVASKACEVTFAQRRLETMNRRTVLFWSIFAGFGVLLLLCPASPLSLFALIFFRLYYVRSFRRDLRYLDALLAECDALMQQATTEEFHPIPASSLPPSIRRLGPSVVLVSRNRVQVECGSGFQHFGFLAYRDAPAAQEVERDERLLERLYYIED